MGFLGAVRPYLLGLCRHGSRLPALRLPKASTAAVTAPSVAEFADDAPAVAALLLLKLLLSERLLWLPCFG